jgi:type II secretion system protein H
MPALLHSARRRDYIGARGFTLMELMVVVILVGILSVMAIPSMGQAAVDRRIYQDTSQISDLIRAAKARAVGRGAAVLVAMDGTGNGKFMVRESVQANPDASGNQVPRSACKSPTDWTVVATPTQYFDVAQVDLNGTFESTNNVQAIIYTDNGSASAAVTSAFLCFTPLGRTYFVSGVAAAAGFLDAATPMTGALSIEVAQRPTVGSTSGLVRRVVIPPSGVTRLLTGGVLP